MARRATLLGLLCMALVSGCGDGLAEVSGTVTIDSQPLAEGEILFVEADRSKAPAAGKIVAGKYALRMPPGSKKVLITASRPTGKPDPVMGTPVREAFIAVEFNEKTRLTAEVKPGKQEGVDFAVKARP